MWVIECEMTGSQVTWSVFRPMYTGRQYMRNGRGLRMLFFSEKSAQRAADLMNAGEVAEVLA